MFGRVATSLSAVELRMAFKYNEIRKLVWGEIYMHELCGTNCCSRCSRREECGSCQNVKGHPFGGNCIVAECIEQGGKDEFLRFKENLISEINGLGIKGVEVNDLNLLNGFFVNLEYPLANGKTVKLLKDNNVYLGNQIEISGKERCYGVVADRNYILVCEYGCNGAEPEIILYKKRESRIC